MGAWRWYWVICIAHKMAVSRTSDAGIYADKRDRRPVSDCMSLWAGHQGSTTHWAISLSGLQGWDHQLHWHRDCIWVEHYTRCTRDAVCSLKVQSEEEHCEVGSVLVRGCEGRQQGLRMAMMDVKTLYRMVIDEVNTRSRPEFVQEGVDEWGTLVEK